MLSAGIDIGSRTIALVVTDGKEIVQSAVVDTGFDPAGKAAEMAAGLGQAVSVTATGYGRHSAKSEYAGHIITEIKAHALGAGYFFPGVRTVLDIGGQDMKVILLDAKGNVEDFQMNDKCAAGTGRFLEVMAGALGYGSAVDFGKDSLTGALGTKISSMCTVFAESEAVSLVHRGTDRRDIGRALHASVVERAFGLIQRVGCALPLAFTGGVALNPCIVRLLGERIKGPVLVPEDPQLVGALGAALSGLEKKTLSV